MWVCCTVWIREAVKTFFQNSLLCVKMNVAETFSALGKILYLWFEAIILFFIPASWREKSIDGEVVLITGAGSGLGQLLAVRFAEKGARVVVWDINQKGLEETKRKVAEVGSKAYTYVCDITKREAVYETAKNVVNEVGNITILVNNAGIVTGTRFMDQPDDKILQTFHVNAISHFWTIKAFLPYMMENNHGHIVTVASAAGLNGSVRLSDYSASKFAAVGLAESLYLELTSDGYTGINTTLVCPFFISTGMFEGVKSSLIPILKPEYVVGRIMEAVLTNQLLLIMPRIGYPLLALKSLLPLRAVTELYATFGGFDFMNDFKGRKTQKKIN